MKPRDVVLLATADWDNPFWTNKQHVACQLAARGFRVLYLDSIGLRRPSARSHDLTRILRRLRRSVAPLREPRAGLHVWSPLALPLQHSPAARAFNRRALTAALRRRLRRLGFHRPLLWTYNPMTADLLDLDDFDGLVYHCVDDIAAQPGMPARVLEEAEQNIVTRADIVFATSPRLAETRGRWNPNTHFLPNVADYDHFVRALDADTVVPDDLARIARPRLGFIGAISGYKVDFELIRHLALQRPHWSLVLIGKVGEGDPWTDPALLEGLPNLYRLGPRPYAELPALLKGIDVALLPSRQNEYTASMFPMKFFEYLAAGRPVVATALPALEPHRDVAHLVRDPADFIAAVESALERRGPDSEAGRRLASEHTWDARTGRMLALLEQTLRRNAEGRAA
jgi:glycosyltransferase involved in cell wall biosynthesis